MKLGWQPSKWLKKKAKAGFRGYPVGTIAFYGPNDRCASKAAVGIIAASDTAPVEMRRWFADNHDVRGDAAIAAEIATFPREHDVRSVSMVDAIIGCPHEEGIDYPAGEVCPAAPFGRASTVGLRLARRDPR
jgi:hypothetical protein